MLCYVGECILLVNTSIIVAKSLAVLVGLYILLVISLTWHELVSIKFKLKSPISILCFFSQDIAL